MVIISQSELLYEALKRVGVPSDFIRVKNADHMYRPYKWDAEISPTVGEMNHLTIEWFQKWLGEPELDIDSIPNRKLRPGIQSKKETHLYYRLTVELPGKTEKSFCRGRFLVRSGGEIMWNFQGEIFDSKLDEKFEIMYMQGEKYGSSIEGLGYHIRINKDKSFDIEKKVYRSFFFPRDFDQSFLL